MSNLSELIGSFNMFHCPDFGTEFEVYLGQIYSILRIVDNKQPMISEVGYLLVSLYVALRPYANVSLLSV